MSAQGKLTKLRYYRHFIGASANVVDAVYVRYLLGGDLRVTAGYENISRGIFRYHTADCLSRLSVGLRGDRAGVDNVSIAYSCTRGYLKAFFGERLGNCFRLILVDLAAKRVYTHSQHNIIGSFLKINYPRIILSRKRDFVNSISNLFCLF